MPDIGPQEILILSGGMGRLLITAIEYEFCATALLKRENSIEGNVDFVVGELPGHVPTPSMMVGVLCGTEVTVISCFVLSVASMLCAQGLHVTLILLCRSGACIAKSSTSFRTT